MWVYLIKSTDLTFSAELEESASLLKNGLNRSPIVKSTPIVKQCSSHEWPMNHFSTVLSGMTLRHWTEIYSKEPLTSFTAAFPARISVLQGMEKAWKESEADYFSKSCAWPKKSSPSSYFWRTCPPLQVEEVVPSLEKLPRWGMIVDGVLYPLHPLERYTVGKDGSCWPTPTARDATRNKGGNPSDLRRKSPNLPTAILKLIATPCASQANKPIRKPSPSRQNGQHGEDLQDSIGRLNPENIGKKLCPRWVSLLMGYPTMWTDCAPWAIQLFQSKQKKLLKY